MKRIFIVAGEVSGDRLAAWYVNKMRKDNPDMVIQAVGGDCLAAAGAYLYERFEHLNIVGIAEIIRHLPRLLRFMDTLATHIISTKIDEVVVVDFPGFNLRLIKKLKQKNPHLTITYLSPPQLWCWGAWRIQKLKRFCDHVIVLYPFEVEWYRKRGLTVQWLGNPVYEAVVPYRSAHKEPMIALIPGSRLSEVTRLLPLFLRVAAKLHEVYPELRFVIPLAQSIPVSTLEAIVRKHNLGIIWQCVTVVRDEQEKFKQLARCCAALSKPGTVTLELALLGVPTVVAFKISWMTYCIARLLVKVPFMSLPNLLLGKELFKEVIQWRCTPVLLAQYLNEVYTSAVHKTETYLLFCKDVEVLTQRFIS